MKTMRLLLIATGLLSVLSLSAQMLDPMPRQAMRSTSPNRSDVVVITNFNELPRQPMRSTSPNRGGAVVNTNFNDLPRQAMRSTSPNRDGAYLVTNFDMLPRQAMRSSSVMLDYLGGDNPIMIAQEEYSAEEIISRIRRVRPGDNEHPYDTPIGDGAWVWLLMAAGYMALMWRRNMVAKRGE